MSGFVAWLLAVLLQPLPAVAVVPVPSVVGLSGPEARSALREVGLRPEAHRATGTACRPRRLVLGQRPAPGAERPAGGRVVIEVNSGALRQCGLDLPAPDPVWLTVVADRFIAHARGRRADSPEDTPVGRFLGGHRRHGCPTGGYAGRTCPFSATRTIAAHPGPLAVTSARPAHPCVHDRRLPGGPHTVTITPDEALDCTSYWAVQLQVNDAHQVVGVNLVWAEP